MKDIIDKFSRVSTALDNRPYLTTIREIAKSYDHITEFGVGEGYNTIALLAAQPDVLTSYDFKVSNSMQSLVDSVDHNTTDFTLIIKNVLQEKIEKTQMLVADTKNTYNQLLMELATHCKQVTNLIVIPNAYKYAYENEIEEVGKKEGLRPAIEEFLQMNPNWEIQIDNEDKDLVVLKRHADH